MASFTSLLTVVLLAVCVVQLNLQSSCAAKLPDYAEDLMPFRYAVAGAKRLTRTTGTKADGSTKGRGSLLGKGKTDGAVGGEAEGTVDANAGGSLGFNFGFGLLQGLNLGGNAETHGDFKATGKTKGLGAASGEGSGGAEGDAEGNAKGGFLFGLFSRSFDGDGTMEEKHKEVPQEQVNRGFYLMQPVRRIQPNRMIYQSRPTDYYYRQIYQLPTYI